MAGPNPYRLYSFEELRRINGPSWLVCEWCQRFAPLAGDLKGKDTRTTSFSCSVCGREAKHVLEDPAKGGKLQFDPRHRPQHHIDAIVRLKVAADRQRLHEERYGKVPREDLPQLHRRERPKPEPPKIYQLKPFPVRTFADIAVWGLDADIGCTRCRRQHVRLEVGENLRSTPLLSTRLRCTEVFKGNVLTPDRVCGGRGFLRMMPAENGGVVPDAPFICVSCGRPGHTGIEVGYLVVNRAPWQGQLGPDERFACPGCGREMTHAWHTTDTSVQRRW